MNTENIKITLRIPISYSTPDRNNTLYTKEAWESAFKSDCKGLPLIAYDAYGRRTAVGMGDAVINNEEIVFDGVVFSGGLACIVNGKMSVDNVFVVEDMQITSFGFESIPDKQI